MVSVVVQIDKRELRHTQATELANGVDVKTVQTRLGHANASITLGWYAHAIPEKDHEAADLLGSLPVAKSEEGEENEASTSENTVEALSKGVETEDEQNLNLRSPGYVGVCRPYPARGALRDGIVRARDACRLSRAQFSAKQSCLSTGQTASALLLRPRPPARI